MKLIIDSRMRKEEKEYLSKYGKLIQIQPQNYVYEEISAHPDIFFCKINNKIFRCPNMDLDIGESGNSKIDKNYPNDVKYNLCQIGNFVIHNFKYTDSKILEYINSSNLEKVSVNQGYSNCSISVTSYNSCITSDIGIHKALKLKNIDCLLLNKANIHLLDKNGLKTKMEGFIGGASCIINNEFILFGDSNYLKGKNKLIEFLKKYNLQLKDFKNLEINDYGGIIIVD